MFQSYLTVRSSLRFDALLLLLVLIPLLLGACDGEATGLDTSGVAGASYTLQTVAGAELPTRFEPCDESGIVNNTRILSGSFQFGTNGRVIVEQQCVGEGDQGQGDIPRLITTSALYRQEGTQVLIEYYGDDFPLDTAIISGATLTVRAQFFRGPSEEQRYVLPMTYVRE